MEDKNIKIRTFSKDGDKNIKGETTLVGIGDDCVNLSGCYILNSEEARNMHILNQKLVKEGAESLSDKQKAMCMCAIEIIDRIVNDGEAIFYFKEKVKIADCDEEIDAREIFEMLDDESYIILT